MGHIFVSYSRKWLYFTESIVLKLQQDGLEVWFDLQRLSPGVDWAVTLANGYKNCNKLLLVASQAALQSPYVQVEWETALQNGREVIVIVSEAVKLPQALRNCPIYDMRANFNQKIRELSAYLHGTRPARHDRAPEPNRWGVSFKMPLSVWITVLIGLTPSIYILLLPPVIAVITSITDAVILLIGEMIALIFVLPSLWIAAPFFKFWQRTISQKDLKDKSQLSLLWLFWVVLMACVLPAGEVRSATTVYANLLALLWFLLTGLSWLTAIYWRFWLLNRSPDILRWFPSGLVEQSMRDKIHGGLIEVKKKDSNDENTIHTSNPVAYKVHYHAADMPISAYITAVFQKVGHNLVSEDQAAVHLILVTNLVSKQWLSNLENKLSGQVIYILATPITDTPEIRPARQKQWVDIRNGDLKVIEALAQYLKNSDLPQNAYAARTSPSRLDEFVLPAYVQKSYTYSRLILGAFFITPMTILFFTQPSSSFVGIFIMLLFPILLLNYLEFLRMRKTPLLVPSFVRRLMGKWLIWYACPAPRAADAIGMTEDPQIRRRRTLLFTVLVVTFAVFASRIK